MRKLFNCLKMLGVFAAFFFIVAAGTDDDVTVITIPEKDSQSCLWQLEAGPHTIYLLGSVHFLRPDAYTLAGLESGLRAYVSVIETKPKAKLELLDELLDLYRKDQLQDWVDEHPCRPE